MPGIARSTLCLLLISHDPRPGSLCQPTEAQESQMAWHHHQEGADLGFTPGHWLQSVLFSPCVVSWCMEGRSRPEKRSPSGPQGRSAVHLSSGPSSLLPGWSTLGLVLPRGSVAPPDGPPVAPEPTGGIRWSLKVPHQRGKYFECSGGWWAWGPQLSLAGSVMGACLHPWALVSSSVEQAEWQCLLGRAVGRLPS